MDFDKLEVFVRVAALGSLSKAAVALDTTSSALSRQMTVLEAECGGRLFHRTGRGVTLTELGQRILPRVQALLQEADELSQEIRGAAGVPAGDVRLGVLAATGASLMPALFKQLRERHPAVRLHVFEGSSGQLEEWLSSSHVDIALVARQGDRFPPNEHPLATSRSCLVSAAGEPLTRQATVPFEALAGVPLILPGPPNGLRRALDQQMRSRGMALNLVMEADSLLVQLAMARQRCGYVILPRHAAVEGVKAGTLAASLIVEPELRRTVTLAITTHRPATLAVREVARLIRTVVEGLTSGPDGVWAPMEMAP